MLQPKRPENIEGYIHPDNTKYTNHSVYKTFTEGLKMKKNEKFGNNIGIKNYIKTKEDINNIDLICPMCSGMSIATCYCIYNDKKCSEGHIWYTDRKGIIKLGNPH
jgi:hypothetical protein